MDQMAECLTQFRAGKKTTETKEMSHSTKISKLRGSGLALADKTDENGKESSLLRGMMLKQIKEIGGK